MRRGGGQGRGERGEREDAHAGAALTCEGGRGEGGERVERERAGGELYLDNQSIHFVHRVFLAALEQSLSNVLFSR